MSDNHNPPCGELLQAAKMTLALLDNMTSEAFSLGADKPAREGLRAAIAQAEGQYYEPEDFTDHATYLAQLHGPELLAALEAITAAVNVNTDPALIKAQGLAERAMSAARRAGSKVFD
jgi:hypothetical protein